MTSDPPGAHVETSNGFLCEATPCEFGMQRKAGFTVTVSKPGFKTANVEVRSETVGAGAAGMAGNVLIGGIIGAGIDATSGAMRDLKPNPVHVKLEPEPSAQPTGTQ